MSRNPTQNIHIETTCGQVVESIYCRAKFQGWLTYSIPLGRLRFLVEKLNINTSLLQSGDSPPCMV